MEVSIHGEPHLMGVEPLSSAKRTAPVEGNVFEAISKAEGFKATIHEAVYAEKPVLEINPNNPIVERLKTETDDSRFSDWSHTLFDQATLAEGGQLEDPATEEIVENYGALKAACETMVDEVYGDREATAVLYHDDPIRVRKRGTGYVLSMRLPFVSRDEMDIHRRGDELFVRVGSYKRNLILPQTLKRMVVREANFAGDHLEILFGRPPSPPEAGPAEGRNGA